MLNVTPLFGVSSSAPHGYLLRCDDYTVLLDCGWTEAFDTSLFDQLTQSATPLHNHTDTPHTRAQRKATPAHCRPALIPLSRFLAIFSPPFFIPL